MCTNKYENMAHSDFKMYDKGIVIKKKESDKDWHINKWNRTESLEINSHIYDQMISDKGTRTTD